MGGIAPIIGALGTAVQAVNTIQTLTGSTRQDRSQELALQQLQQQQALQQQQLAQDNALTRQQIALEAAQDEEDRRAALKRAVARQRANFGSQGISQSNAGSAQAVLLGLANETEEELAQREALDNLRSTALDLNESQTRSLNVLQATQLAQRNNVTSLYDRINSANLF